MKPVQLWPLALALLLSPAIGRAQNCSGLPTQFTGNEFPTGDFFSNFNNDCYLIPLASQGPSLTDLNDTYWQIFYKVDPRYQLIIVGTFPNARYFSLTANDDHYLISQTILDTNVVPLTSSFVNPYRPGVPYASGQQYAIPLNFGGTPGNIETGCMTSAYNVHVNAMDGTLRHQGQNWNTDAGYMAQSPPLHIVDTPQHSNPTAAGYLMVRAYLDNSLSDPSTVPAVIVRDVASGCAYPAAYALNTLEVVSPQNGNTWMNQQQLNEHENYAGVYLPFKCYALDPQNSVSWTRDEEFIKLPNPDSSYIKAVVPTNLPATLASAGEVMRFRLRLPTTPPTPCTNGCSRSGNEQMRYVGLSFYPSSGGALASLADSYFTKDANGYATLIVGTGAAIPSWITPANGYTFLDLTTISGYKGLENIQLRNILSAVSFSCGVQVVPYKTTVYTPDGNMIGDYLPEVDYPVASTLPQTASELHGTGVCGILPNGVPEISPACGVLAPNPTTIASIPAPAPGENPIAVQPLPPITLSGEGFGFLPQGLAYSGNTNYLELTDITQNWSAGLTGDTCILSISYWDDARIEVVANANINDVCPMAAGDQLAISVWNPQAGTGPVTANVTVAADVSYTLGTNTVNVGSAAGSSSVELITTGPWTATSQATWLHVASNSTGGTGGAVVQFAYDANTTPNVQTGTIAIGGQTLTVIQAGNTYVPVTYMAPLVTGLNSPQGVAVDATGIVYIADTGSQTVKSWNPSTGKLKNLISSGLGSPTGVSLDLTRQILYIADPGNHAIESWTSANPHVTTLAPGVTSPYGVAVDSSGNVYFADASTNAMEEWNAATTQVTTLASGAPISNPLGVGVDGFGNVYTANPGDNAIVQWNLTGQQLSILDGVGLSAPAGLTLDGQGNVYLTETGTNDLKQLNAATRQPVVLVSSGLNSPSAVTVDAAGNLYIADTNNNAVEKVTMAFLSLSATNLNELQQAGSDSIAYQVLPAGTVVAASSDQTWLTITSATGGTVAFTFQANTSGAGRVAHISILGDVVTVNQTGDTLANVTKSQGDGQSTATGQLFPIALAVTATDVNSKPIPGLAVTFTAVAGASGASGTFASSQPVITDQNGVATATALTANSIGGAFTVSATVESFMVTFNLTNLPYHLASSSLAVGNTAGSGSVQLAAGGAWTASSNASWLTLLPGSRSGSGNALIEFDYTSNANTTAQTGTITISGLLFTVTQAPAGYVPVYAQQPIVSSNLGNPKGVAVDAQGNIYIADGVTNAIDVWNAGTQQLSQLAAHLNNPSGVAVDSQGNVYFTDTGNNEVKEWKAATQTVSTLVSKNIVNPIGILVDGKGNVYFTDAGHNALKEWIAATGTVTTLVGSTLDGPTGIAMDAFGNVFIADTKHRKIREWSAVNGLVSTVVSNLRQPYALAVDGGGNIYVTDTETNTVAQWNAATQQMITLVSGLSSPYGIASDSLGNLTVSNSGEKIVERVMPGYLLMSTTGLSEGQPAGSDHISAQIFPTSNPLVATSNESWLTVTSTTGGQVDFSVTANDTVRTRVAQVAVCGIPVKITQSADTATAIVKTAGTGQSTGEGKAFPTRLQVKLKDAEGNPVQSVAVTFTVTPGSNGASGTFASSPKMPIPTTAQGLATAPVLTANGIAGTFTVTATAGSLSTSFTLQITAH